MRSGIKLLLFLVQKLPFNESSEWYRDDESIWMLLSMINKTIFQHFPMVPFKFSDSVCHLGGNNCGCNQDRERKP